MYRLCSPILVVIATLNEEEGIGPTLEELKNVLSNCSLIVVDGNSADRTVEIAKKLNLLEKKNDEQIIQELENNYSEYLKHCSYLNNTHSQKELQSKNTTSFNGLTIHRMQ